MQLTVYYNRATLIKFTLKNYVLYKNAYFNNKIWKLFIHSYFKLAIIAIVIKQSLLLCDLLKKNSKISCEIIFKFEFNLIKKNTSLI